MIDKLCEIFNRIMCSSLSLGGNVPLKVRKVWKVSTNLQENEDNNDIINVDNNNDDIDNDKNNDDRNNDDNDKENDNDHRYEK